MAEGAAAASVGPPGRLVVVTGAARGIGVGICRQVLLQDAESEVVVAARDLSRAEAVAGELGARAHAIQCDVSSTSSCGQAAEAIASLRRGRALSLVNNAGVAYDLPWFPTPWPANAARDTVEVNLLGARRMTQSLLPHLLDPRSPGRVVLVSSGAGPLNMKRMAEPRRQELLAESLEWDSVEALAEEFVREYEAAAQAHEAGGPSLPFLSASGLWLQSYGFSKACLNAYCRILAREHPSLLCCACSPGFVETDMVRTYAGESALRSIDEGGDVPAWLACGDVAETGCYFGSDRSRGAWVAE